VVKRNGHGHGSFPRYYVERGVSLEADLDPRIRAMRPDWFNARRCLDIGCNSGDVAIAIARRWCCASMIGIDLDEQLVARARSALAELGGGDLASDGAPAHVADGGDGPKAESAAQPPVPVALALSMGLIAPEARLRAPAPLFPHSVRFAAVDATSACEVFGAGSFETILCLSTSKWVHLNGGDPAIIALFEQVYRMLADGGAFVFEPQPWSSYKRKKHVSDVARAQFAEIKLRPERFVEYLIDRVGFRAVEQIRVEYDASVSKGFASRPLYLFIK
jgi:7SK snRNA methylphosphate capping enzyme